MTGNPQSEDEAKLFGELWSFTPREIRQGRYTFPIRDVLRGNPATSLLYAVLCSIYEGVSNRSALYNHLDGIFALRLRRPTKTSLDIDEAIQHGFNEHLITESNGQFIVTEKGREVIRYGRLEIVHQGHWMKLFFTEKVTLAVSTIMLIALATVKILIGLGISSDAIFTEGVENFTDLIVVAVIGLSIHYNKDRLGAITITTLMIVTGAMLAYSALEGLLSGEYAVVWAVEAFYVEFLSIIFNRILIQLKVTVGRSSGNLAFISDAKEDTSHIKVAIGVMIGLTFAIFKIYWVDSLMALLISGIVILEGINTIRELHESGEDIDVDTIRLGANEMYEDLITYWILGRLTGGPKPISAVNQDFLTGVKIGHRYYDVQAVIGFHNIMQRGIMKNIRQAERSGLIEEHEGMLSITNRGLSWFYRLRARELADFAREFSGPRKQRYIRWAIYVTIFVLIFVIMWYASEIKQLVDDFVSIILP